MASNPGRLSRSNTSGKLESPSGMVLAVRIFPVAALRVNLSQRYCVSRLRPR